MIIMLLICVNSAYEKKNYLGENAQTHIWSRIDSLFLPSNVYGNQDEMGDEVSETGR